MGLGLFADCDIAMGDLIVAERPLIVTPGAIDLNIKYFEPPSSDRKRQIVLLEWENILSGCFQRLSSEGQNALMSLANCNEEDDIGPLLGIIKTNGFVMTIGEGFYKEYSAVCKDLSRVNHR